ncbi:hypothetical protein AWW72_08070 [Acinetobacter sp. NRRL B-65365]|uniref:PilC/PilY family type IV pilus protein n=1 Tax=Acinetobacter sp. NRRL B-65365 TaxID=1785092 RepID=UPI0007A0D5DB|nr:PilC/PilY family type IV pilus protein [Acinetobacter sp. NRRL B-65365]KYQ84594.1 hypothetical protein AWW72_08070 [Acinetobacter sp. NRRL B-65365]
MKNNKIKQKEQTDLNNNSTKWFVLVSSALSCLLVVSPATHASDVEIYRQGSSGGNSTIMLMVDTSQSMGSPALDLLKDYPLCISSKVFAVVGALPVVDVKLTPPAGTEAYCDVVFPKAVLDLLSTVDTITGTQKNSLLGLQSSLDYMRASCTPFSKLEASEPVRSNKILSVNINLGEGYRCYSRLSRIKMAVRDVLNGNAKNGVTALSPKTAIGLTVAPAKNSSGVNQKAGMIVVPALELGYKKGDKDESGAVVADDSNQRKALKAAIDGLAPSSDPLGNTLDKVVGILGNVLDGLNILGLVTDVLGLIGSLPATLVALLNNPESPLVTAYAETGAYLLGHNTRGTGEVLSEFEVSVAKPSVAYKCLTRQTNNDCTSYHKKNSWPIDTLIEYPIPTGYIRTEQVTPSNGVLGDLLGALLGLLSGNTNKSVIRYYYAADASYSGYNYRSTAIPMKANSDEYDNPTSIKQKISGATTSQCQAQGIFVLTGNAPKLVPADALGVQRIMQKSLGKAATTNINDFCKVSPPSGWELGTSTATWACLANYSKALLDTNAAYRTQVEIKTGVAGIGKEFNYVRLNGDNVIGAGTGGSIVNTLLSSVKSLLNAALSLLSIIADLRPLLNVVDIILPTQPTTDAELGDVRNLAYWGKEGKGGWYTEASTGGIAQSIVNFNQRIADVESAPFMGLQTIPADPLTPYQLSNDVYNSMFAPADQQNWFGNLKKYSVTDMTSGNNVIRMVDWKDQWNSNELEDQDKNTKLFTGGALGQLKTLRPTKTDTSARKLWINRNCKTDGSFTESSSLKKVTTDYLADSSEARCAINASAKDSYGGYLMSLLGYQLDNPESATGNSLTQSEPLWQVGMPLHSTPLKLTQYAKFDTNKIDRDDYIAFGSTQGLLHVVDADDGKEKFAFLPNEMLENAEQRKAFVKDRKGYWPDMAYGIDGAWTAYTEYAYGMGSDGKVYATVQQAKNKDIVIATGKQTLYGGLRMGGRSYYALNLADLDKPEIKFHIDPNTGKVYSAANPSGQAFSAIENMGQSWSKPTIAYVNWKGQRKQVMFVGGGYDASGTVACAESETGVSLSAYSNKGYECPIYNQTNKKGAGVYMFDADNGDLLWWASSSATTKNDTAKENALNVSNMDYSVVSRISVADRDGNGLVDHLYFGDLGGQVWRVDINANTTTGDFAQRATRILNLHKTGGLSPRFFDAPNFTVYGYEQPLAVISIASGNRSLPASDSSSGAIYNLFDRDVIKTNLYTLSADKLETKDIDLTTTGKALRGILSKDEAKDKNIAEVKALMPNGWAVSFSNAKKVTDEMVVMNKNLYASVYDRGVTPSCPVQVRGKTEVYRYCLPFGVCEQTQLSESVGLVGKSGDGIVALSVGAGSTSKNNLQSRGLISGNSSNTLSGLPVNQMRRQLVPLTWYERNE